MEVSRTIYSSLSIPCQRSSFLDRITTHGWLIKRWHFQATGKASTNPFFSIWIATCLREPTRATISWLFALFASFICARQMGRGQPRTSNINTDTNYRSVSLRIISVMRTSMLRNGDACGKSERASYNFLLGYENFAMWTISSWEVFRRFIIRMWNFMCVRKDKLKIGNEII